MNLPADPALPERCLVDPAPSRRRFLAPAPSRRRFLALGPGLAASWIAAPSLLRAADGGFGFDAVVREAAALAARPYRPLPAPDRTRAGLTYDAKRRIRFNPEHALWRTEGNAAELQFFPVAGKGSRAITVHTIEGGSVKPLRLAPAAFIDDDGVLPADAGPPPVAGWRLTGPLNTPGKRDEVIAFLGASYFRALGAGQRYGLSARGLAVDTVGGVNGQGPEEFPFFTTFWIERPDADSPATVFYALLDGPSVAGAYRFELKPGATTTLDVRARLFMRRAGARIGLAPLTSMFSFGENQPAGDDFRPEVHDSDGLQIETARGEWIWRPLINPAGTFVTSFSMPTPRGFGLMQRDRAFASYEDLEARYERRPSAWVQPLSDWGPGRIELVQLNTPDETHDNIVAYWVPDQLPVPGDAFEAAWRIHWCGEQAPRPPGAWAVQTRRGVGWRKANPVTGKPLPASGRLLWHVDFDGPALKGLDPETVEAVVSSPGARVLRAQAFPNEGRGGWRMTVEIARPDPRRAIELRAYLKSGVHTLTETWSYALAPE